ncbi:hypothetical protein [Streptomyces pactum]|uniref:hypothetical protein n=1 Tax=Streptomyces pactum TaxID=68249 RepID=UPI003701B7A0
MAQVAGSALAAVTAAVLASRLGVYGTIIGAGVVSVVATAGGSLLQHLFRRTGEVLRPAARPLRHPGPGHGSGGRSRPGRGTGGPPRAVAGAYGAPTVHGTRLRGGRRTLVAAGAVFVLAMGTVTGIELLAGGPLSNLWGQDRAGTTVGGSVGRHPARHPAPAPDSGRPASGGTTPRDPAPGPSAGTGGGDRSARPSGAGREDRDQDREGTAPARPAPTGDGTATEDPATPAPAPSGATVPPRPSGSGGTPVPTPPPAAQSTPPGG